MPDAITRAFEQSQYASYFVDEIDLYETPEEEFYLFELESNRRISTSRFRWMERSSSCPERSSDRDGSL